MVGGLISSTVLNLIIIPELYDIWKRWELRHAQKASAADTEVTEAMEKEPTTTLRKERPT